MKHLIIIIFTLFAFNSNAQKVSVKGNWSKTFRASDISFAGLDYDQSYESNTKQTKLTITPVPNSKYNRLYMPFKVFVHKEDENWNNNILLELKVSSTSHGNASGTSYQALTNNMSTFFNTVGKRKNIPIQYRVSGISVTLPVTNYITEIVYTVLNL